MTAQSEAPAQSFNVMGQVTGGIAPEEVVVLGGHIDSWDVGLVRIGSLLRCRDQKLKRFAFTCPFVHAKKFA